MESAPERPAMEVKARRYLRVFPAWVRGTRGEEAVSLVLDQVPATATRLPMRAHVDLVRAGLQQRRREIPPPSVWWTVHAASIRSSHGWVPARWHPWLLHLARPRWCRLRYAARMWCVLVSPLVAVAVAAGGRDGVPGGAMVSLLGFCLVWSVLTDWHRVVLERNGYGPDCRPLPPAARRPQAMPPMAPNVPLREVADSLAGCVALASLVALMLLVWWPKPGVDLADDLRAGLVGAASAAVGLGLLRRRARRIEPERSPDGSMPIERWGRDATAMWLVPMLLPILVVAIAAESDLGLLAVAGSNVLAVGMCIGVRRTERRVGRRIGLWDIAPNAIARTVWTRELPQSGGKPPSSGSPTTF